MQCKLKTKFINNRTNHKTIHIYKDIKLKTVLVLTKWSNFYNTTDIYYCCIYLHSHLCEWFENLLNVVIIKSSLSLS